MQSVLEKKRKAMQGRISRKEGFTPGRVSVDRILLIINMNVSNIMTYKTLQLNASHNCHQYLCHDKNTDQCRPNATTPNTHKFSAKNRENESETSAKRLAAAW